VGLISLGQSLFFGAGAYATGFFNHHLGLPPIVTVPLGTLCGAIFCTLLLLPVLRIRGVYFAIITWGAGATLRFIYIRFKEPFGGPLGIFSIPAPDPIPLPGIGVIDFDEKVHYYFLALILMVFTLYILHRMEKSRFGLIFGAIREGDQLARAVGINIMNYKVLAFAVCSGLAAMGGSFYAHYTYYISPLDFTVLLTIYLAIYTVVGGQESFVGPIIGAVVLMLAGEVFAGYAHLQLLLYSGFLIFILLFLPGGLVSLPHLVSEALRRLTGRGKKDLGHGSAGA
jgi:branched-chain amino acid transport system permease protein